MTQKEFAAMGGQARAKKLSKERQIEIARNAGLASAKQRKLSQTEGWVKVIRGQRASKSNSDANLSDSVKSPENKV